MTYKLVYLARRAPTVSREDWPRTWKSHAVFASQFPVLEARIDWMRYCNRVEMAMPGLSTAHDGVAVAAGETLEALNGAGFSPADRALIDADERRVFDMLTPEFTYYCEEQVIGDGPLGEFAVWRFLRRRPDLAPREFAAAWDAYRPPPPHAATRHVRNHPVHAPRPLFPFDGIGECWFVSADEAIASIGAMPLPDFCDRGACVTILTAVCHRWPKG